ncbi:beta-N-acetylhexosaminidase [Agitococcus lubricus]|uniref:Beta-hexosaminidase n=1 Tax=Agitococcus lubricus TaxID=1077255 RepID=A0A2T5IVI8_9GAMM|nr:beta-N-acetylhexosaminidase [Agitococcus lubricus]PTQ87920.1 beta-N-acetylhexosaminidase [Agitococcus lubricus]
MNGALMLDVVGVELDAEEKELLAHPDVGGLIFFARNYTGPDQIQALVHSIRAIRPEIILAVDQEGGRVQRFREGFVRLPSMKTFGDLFAHNADEACRLAHQCGWLMATEVLSVGVDISFAPILDVDCGLSRVIGDRSFHENPQVAVALLREFIRGMHQAGMAATGKHFPGHGSVEADSHVAIPVDKRSFAEIDALDLVPFRALCHELQGIMPAHVIYPEVDDKPAGFSPIWLQDLLRQQMGYKGVIFSDDLSMEGAGVVGGYADRADAALNAGCDMVLACNNRQGAIQILEYLERNRRTVNQSRFDALRGKAKLQWNDLPHNPQWLAAEESIRELVR